MLRAVWRFRRFLRRHLFAFTAGALLVVVETMIDLAQPWPLKVIIDGVIGRKAQEGWLPAAIAGTSNDPQTVLIRALGATVVLVGLSAFFAFASDLLMNRAGQRVVVAIRAALFGHLQRLSLSFHSAQRVGDLVGRVTTDIDRSQNMLVAMFDTLIPNTVMLIGLTAVMLAVDFHFGLLALSIAPPLFFLTYRYTLRIRQASRQARQADSDLAAMANETLGAIRAVQAFSRESYEDRRFERRNRMSLQAGLTAIKLKATLPSMVDLVSLGGTLLVTYAGVQRVLDGRMSLGVLLVFLSYLKSLYKPMRALSKMSYVVSQGVASAQRVDDILRADERIPESRRPVEIRRLDGHVELRNVTFRYSPDATPVLHEASLIVQPGERVGIVGQTGAGKSTLVSLIPRFYDAERGAVLLDGVDVRELELTSLRRQVSLVLQEAFLFYGTIFDNIRYGDPSASPERVWEVARLAHVTEFLDRLPDGWLTRVGERGATLSGGQKQRIAIARAMLLDAPILILDEPTTGLDQQSEALVVAGLKLLSRNRTTFIIAHHAAALSGVDRIIEVRGGQLQQVYPSRRPVQPKPMSHGGTPRFSGRAAVTS